MGWNQQDSVSKQPEGRDPAQLVNNADGIVLLLLYIHNRLRLHIRSTAAHVIGAELNTFGRYVIATCKCWMQPSTLSQD